MSVCLLKFPQNSEGKFTPRLPRSRGFLSKIHAHAHIFVRKNSREGAYRYARRWGARARRPRRKCADRLHNPQVCRKIAQLAKDEKSEKIFGDLKIMPNFAPTNKHASWKNSHFI